MSGLTGVGGLSFFDDQVLRVFDGRAFRAYNEDQKFKVQKPANILKDQHGAFWFVTKDARLISLKDGVFSSYAINGLPREAVVTALLQDHRGAIWIGTARHGLGRLQDGILTIYPEVKGIASAPSTKTVKARSGSAPPMACAACAARPLQLIQRKTASWAGPSILFMKVVRAASGWAHGAAA